MATRMLQTERWRWFVLAALAGGLTAFALLLKQPGAVRAQHAPAVVADGGAPPTVGLDPASQRRATAASVLERLFRVLDCERQGLIRPNEVEEHIAQVLGVYDRDGSRTISLSEYVRDARGERHEQLAALFAEIDASGDGIVSAKELIRHVVGLMAVADANTDGEVTRAELTELSRESRPAVAR
jgi:Ca2+-binding EF-hand superfamily protein